MHLSISRTVMRILKYIIFLVIIVSLVQGGLAYSRERDDDYTLRIADILTAAPINPFFTTSTISANLLDLIYDPLVGLNRHGEMMPALAQSWEKSKDGLVWSFKLAHGVTFHDGSSFSAHDVKATLDALRNLSGSFYSFGLSNVKNVEVLSEHDLRITLKRFDSFFPFFLRHIFIVPADLLGRGMKDMPVVGTGPFKLNSFSPTHIELGANEHYFLGKPKLKKIIVDKCSNQRACLSRLMADEADLIFLTDAKDYDVFSGIEGIDLISNAIAWRYVVVFNHRSPIFKDKRIRQALNYAVDRSQLASEKIGEDLFSSFSYDPRRAMRLIKDAGWKRGRDSFLYKNAQKMRLTLVLHESDEVSKFNARMLQEFLERLGISVELKVFPSLKDALNYCYAGNDFDAIMMPMNARSGMPVHYLFLHSSLIDRGSNFSGYMNEKVDRLLDKIRYSNDPMIREKAMRELSAAFRDDPPAIVMAVRNVPSLVNSRYKGFSEDPFNFFSSLRSVTVKEDK